MICTGTGIAPFISFMQELDFINKKPYETYLIFGSKNKDADYLFEDEIKEYLNTGVLKEMHCAFSRDQDEKIYVQDVLIKEFENRLVDMVKNEGMHIYVCGSMSMGMEVTKALSKILGADTLDEMSKTHRLVKEFWENK